MQQAAYGWGGADLPISTLPKTRERVRADRRGTRLCMLKLVYLIKRCIYPQIVATATNQSLLLTLW